VPTPAHYLKPDLNIPPAISLVLMKALEKRPGQAVSNRRRDVSLTFLTRKIGVDSGDGSGSSRAL